MSRHQDFPLDPFAGLAGQGTGVDPTQQGAQPFGPLDGQFDPALSRLQSPQNTGQMGANMLPGHWPAQSPGEGFTFSTASAAMAPGRAGTTPVRQMPAPTPVHSIAGPTRASATPAPVRTAAPSARPSPAPFGAGANFDFQQTPTNHVVPGSDQRQVKQLVDSVLTAAINDARANGQRLSANANLTAFLTQPQFAGNDQIRTHVIGALIGVLDKHTLDLLEAYMRIENLEKHAGSNIVELEELKAKHEQFVAHVQSLLAEKSVGGRKGKKALGGAHEHPELAREIHTMLWQLTAVETTKDMSQADRLCALPDPLENGKLMQEVDGQEVYCPDLNKRVSDAPNTKFIKIWAKRTIENEQSRRTNGMTQKIPDKSLNIDIAENIAKGYLRNLASDWAKMSTSDAEERKQKTLAGKRGRTRRRALTVNRRESAKLLTGILEFDVEVYCITDEASSHESFDNIDESLVPESVKAARSEQGCGGQSKATMIKPMAHRRREYTMLLQLLDMVSELRKSASGASAILEAIKKGDPLPPVKRIRTGAGASQIPSFIAPAGVVSTRTPNVRGRLLPSRPGMYQEAACAEYQDVLPWADDAEGWTEWTEKAKDLDLYDLLAEKLFTTDEGRRKLAAMRAALDNAPDFAALQAAKVAEKDKAPSEDSNEGGEEAA